MKHENGKEMCIEFSQYKWKYIQINKCALTRVSTHSYTHTHTRLNTNKNTNKT